MFKIKNYKMGFDIWGLILFFVIMFPNFVWFAVPAINDVLRVKSITPHADMVASVCQIVMVAALCMIINRHRQKPMEKALLRGISTLIMLYYTGWCLYYAGIVNLGIILDLCITPCLAFALFSMSRKNAVALMSASIFTLCHVFYAIMNFG